MNVVFPTLAVVFTWSLTALVLAGCGVVVGRGLRALAPRGRGELRLSTALWLGLAAFYAYLEFWNLFLPIGWTSWPLPLAVACAGLLIAARRARRPRLSARAVLVFVGLALVVLWFANQALGPAIDYDLGLYHLNVIGYAEHYRTIPGLANLHSRLGAGDAQLLVVAFLAHGPWAGAAFHLLVGLLVSLLLFELGARLVQPPPASPSFTRRVAVFLVPATVVLAAMTPQVRVASPNLDLAAFVLVSAGMLYLADCVESGPRLPEACVAVGALAVASTTRPLFWLTTLLALVVLALLAHGRRLAPARIARSAAAVCALPALLALGWMARQTVLSGYPLYPLTLGSLPVDWKVPLAVIVSQNQGDDAWARWPGVPPSFVLSSWQWLTSWWLPMQKTNLAVIAPLLLLGCLAPALASRGDPGRRRRRVWPMLAIVVPSLVTLGVWFHVAPDPRFVWAPIWLVPIALAAWALPPLGRPALAPLAAGLVTGVVLTLLLVHHFVWLLPALLVLWAWLFALALVLRRRGAGAFLAHAAAVSAVVVAVGVVVDRNALSLVHANQPGPFGTPLVPAPSLTTVQTDSGLRLSQTVGSDQCFGVLLCTPLLINDHLHMRGPGVSSGFSVRARA